MDVSIATYQRIRSKRKFGVEVETHRCRGYRDLVGRTKFGCKSDCSIGGREFVSPILYGDEGLSEIETFLANASQHRWAADDCCGCHTHYDMRDESNEELYGVVYAYAKTYGFWKFCVSSMRRGNGYCHSPRYDVDDIRHNKERGTPFQQFARGGDRYDYVNIYAYNIHKTFENRLLEGTVDAVDICNWITIHCRFIDYVKKLSFDDLDTFLAGNTTHVLSALAVITDDASLTGWLTVRIQDNLR